MSERTDDRIRELYAELTESTPPLPPLPAPATRTWRRRLPTIAMSAAVVILVIATTPAVLTVGGDSEDASETTIVAATTGAPATTAAATTGAPPATTTTVAAATTGAPGTTLAPVDALGVQCRAFIDATGDLYTLPPGDEEAYESSLDVLEGELFGLRTTAGLLGSADDRASVGVALGDVAAAIDVARGGFAAAPSPLVPIRDALNDLDAVLVDLGAVDCADLGDFIAE